MLVSDRYGFVFVNYNNSSYSIALLKSIYSEQSAQSITTVIVDNSDIASERDELLLVASINSNIKIIFNEENIGYFQALNVGIRFLRNREQSVQTVIVGNNDLIFPEKFIEVLEDNMSLLDMYPVVSPDIVTLDGVHQNPHVKYKPSFARELIWDLYHSNYAVGKFMMWINNRFKRNLERKDYTEHHKSCEMLQGYGACYILTPVFFNYWEELWSPTFLMGEENWLRKQIGDEDMCMYYCPSIKIAHHDHATISKLPSRRTWEYNKIAHKIYRKHVTSFKNVYLRSPEK